MLRIPISVKYPMSTGINSSPSNLPRRLSISSINISSDAHVPRNPRHKQAEPSQESNPKQPAPFPKAPSTVSQCPPSDSEVYDVRDEEGREQGAHDFLLECGMGEEVLACRAEHEEVDETE